MLQKVSFTEKAYGAMHSQIFLFYFLYFNKPCIMRAQRVRIGLLRFQQTTYPFDGRSSHLVWFNEYIIVMKVKNMKIGATQLVISSTDSW